MTKEELRIVYDLFFQARDAFEKDNSDHRHLAEALLETVGLLHTYKLIDDGLYAAECDFLDYDFQEELEKKLNFWEKK